MTGALVIIAAGTEEIEAVAPADVLCRAGVVVTLAGVGGLELAGRNGLPLRAVLTTGAVRASGARFDAVVIPGGKAGAEAIAADEDARAIIAAQAERGGLVAAICAAPALVLAPMGLLKGRRATCYPGFEDRLAAHAEGEVVEDGPFITSRGPGTAIAFGLAVAQRLAGAEAASRVAAAMLVDGWCAVGPVSRGDRPV